MSQERLTSNPNAEHPGGSTHVFPSTLQSVGQAPHAPAEEASTMLPTPNRYWRLFNDPGLAPPDPGLSPITPGLGPPVVTTEAFLGLTQQVRTLTGMIQAIVPYIPQLAQAPTHQHPHVPLQTVQQEAPQSRPSQGEHPGGAPRPPVEAAIENPNASVSQPLNRSRDVMRLPPEPDVVSSDSTNSMREQLRQVNQRIDKVQRDFVRSKEEVGETTKGRSPKRLRQVQLVTIGFTGDSVSPAGTTALPVTIGEEPRSKTLLVSFIVVALPLAYNAIIGKPTLNKLRAVVSTYHRVMKFPTRAGVGEV
ncbi:hypothetical protein BHM03_00055646 [Ensete ventricosum]|nr:hypothetical protein BHM03_00055646 [Ensete ventricosum]